MRSTTLRSARPLMVHSQRLAIASRVQQSAHLTTWTSLLNSRGRSTLGANSGRLLVQNTARTQMSSKPPLQPNKIDKEFEKEIAEKKLEARPEEVTSTSSVRHVLEQSQAPPESNPDVMVGLKNDLNTVKETFALASVPQQAYTLGLAGTLPYLATSVSTVWLSWGLNTQYPTQSTFLNAFLFDHASATHWLQILEPIQVGYGAVIISFLGAIHWGLEFAEKATHPERTRLRYAIGVLAPAVAWPTIFMPTEWALTTQFAAFCALYFTDSRATVRGWVPSWYGTYRFVLTAVVGAAILISLVGRAKVGEGHTRLSAAELKERIQGRGGPSDTYRNWAKEEEEERKRLKEEKKKEEKKKKEAEKKTKEGGQKKKGAKKEGQEGSKQEDGEDEDTKQQGDDKNEDDQKGDEQKGDEQKGDEQKGDEQNGDEQKGDEKKEADVSQQQSDEQNKSEQKEQAGDGDGKPSKSKKQSKE